jgi:prepilin-type N-terminal cleavage/methylation domain-containing protein
MRPTPPRTPRGFTLIELMVVVSIVGVLSSVAVPVFQNLTLRARQAERDSIMRAIAKGVEDVALNSARIPVNSGTFFVGNWNPVPVPDTSKQSWTRTPRRCAWSSAARATSTATASTARSGRSTTASATPS